jgi:hypothetical protein
VFPVFPRVPGSKDQERTRVSASGSVATVAGGAEQQ